MTLKMEPSLLTVLNLFEDLTSLLQHIIAEASVFFFLLFWSTLKNWFRTERVGFSWSNFNRFIKFVCYFCWRKHWNLYRFSWRIPSSIGLVLRIRWDVLNIFGVFSFFNVTCQKINITKIVKIPWHNTSALDEFQSVASYCSLIKSGC